MKRIVFKITAAFCISFVFALFSCSEITQKIDGGGQDTESEQEFTITGTLSVDVNGAVPSEVAKSVYGDFESDADLSGRSVRTANPSLPASITYRVTATSTSGKTTKDEDFTVSGNSFTIKLFSTANETWTVKAEGFSDSARTTKILEGSTPVNLSPNTVGNNISITLYQINSGNGAVNLPISVAADSGIQSAIVKVFEDAKETKQVTVTPALEYNFSTKKDATISANNLASGTRYFVITFYSVDLQVAKTNPNQNVAYQVHETVNIFQNLTTNTWQGNASYLTGGQFRVTKNLVDTFSRKEFFVQGTNGTYTPPTAAASDNNTGTYFDPFATVQKAVDTINSINDGISPYTIKVDGTLTITSQNASSGVIIQPKDKNLNLTIESVNTSKKATIQAKPSNDDMRVFIVGNGATPTIEPNVTMNNLIVTGGRFGTGGGSGIKLEAGNLTLSNVDVTGNSTTDVGGGIYISSGTCTINGGTISNNSAESNGGGICVESAGSIKIGGTEANQTTLLGNQLTGTDKETGTAIFVGKGAEADLSGNVSITPGIAQGGALPTIYLEKGQQGQTTSGGPGGWIPPISDAVLKLGGIVQIGNGSGTGIKMEKTFWDTANIKITSSLASAQTIAINIADITEKYSASDYLNNYNDKPIIEAENYSLTQADCDKFSIDNKIIATYVIPLSLKLSLDANKGKLGIKQ